MDGGIDPETVGAVVEAGANVLVAGSAVFRDRPYRQAVETLRARAAAARRLP